MTAVSLWLLFGLVMSWICYNESKIENKEYRLKYGMTRKEFRHYRKMMTSSSYRAKHKKSPAKAEPSQSMHHYN